MDQLDDVREQVANSEGKYPPAAASDLQKLIDRARTLEQMQATVCEADKETAALERRAVKYKVGADVAARLQNCFSYHPPLPGQTERYEDLRSEAHWLAALFCENCPPSRELSLALTKLEESVMWANAAIARNERASYPEV